MKGSEIKVSLSFVCPLLWTPQLWRDMVGSLPPKRCIIRARLILRHRSTHTWKHGVHFGWKASVEEGKEKVAIWTGKEKYWSPRTWFWCKARFCASCTMEHRGTRDCIKETESTCIARKDKISPPHESARNPPGKKYGPVLFELLWIITKWRRPFRFWALWQKIKREGMWENRKCWAKALCVRIYASDEICWGYQQNVALLYFAL